MHQDPDIFIVQPSAALVPRNPNATHDPLSGRGTATDSYIRQNPSVMEYDRFREKDYSVNVFSTANELLYTQYQNNIITPIIFRHNYDPMALHNYISDSCERGVYIVETYNLIGVSPKDTSNFIDYYRDTKGIAYSSDVIESINKTVGKDRLGRVGKINSVIRIVTYIPISTLISNQFTYIMGPGIVIIHGAVPDNLHHPYSPEYLENELLTPASAKGSVTIDISIVDAANKPYYYILGNEVRVTRPLSTKTGSALPEGCTILTRRGDTVLDEKYFTLKEFEENGFYRSKDLCLSNGNKTLLTEEAKFKVEMRKIEHELYKLKEANERLVLEKVARERQHELDLDKRQQDLRYSKASKQLDLAHTATKFTLDTLGKRMDLSVGKIKLSYDLARMEADTRRAIDLANLKQTDGVVKLIDTAIKLFK